MPEKERWGKETGREGGGSTDIPRDDAGIIKHFFSLFP